MLGNSIQMIVPPWSWKAAACTAVVRALAFYATDVQSGRNAATKAMPVEVTLAVFTGGLIGAVFESRDRIHDLRYEAFEPAPLSNSIKALGEGRQQTLV